MNEIRAVNNKLELVAAADHIAINDKIFALDAIDRVAYWSVSRRLNGAYMGTSFWIKLAAQETSAYFFMESGSRNDRLEEGRDVWQHVVAILQAAVTPRIACETIAAIDRGQTVNFGGIGGTAADARGLRARKPLAKPIAWSDMVGTTFENGRLRIVARSRKGGEPKPRLLIGMELWNAVAVPDVVGHYCKQD